MSATLKNGSNQYRKLVAKKPPVKPLPRVRQIFLTLRGNRGGDRRSENFKSDNITLGSKPKHGSTSRLYIEDRLQRNQQEAKP